MGAKRASGNCARLLGLTVAALAASSFSAPLPVTLIWQAPEECPQYAEVWARLSERLGQAPATPTQSSFAARGLVVKVEKGFRIELQTLNQSGAGTRQFTHASCEELTRLAVVSLSMAIDPTLEPPPEVVPRSLWLGIGPAASLGILPLPAAGLSADLVLELLPVSFQFSLETALPQRYAKDDGRALRVGLPFGGGLDACLGVHGTRFSARGCANLHAALLTGEAEGVSRPRAGLGALLSLGPRLQGQLLLHSRVALRLTIDGSVALVRPSFAFASGEVAFSPSLFSFSGALTVEFKIW